MTQDELKQLALEVSLALYGYAHEENADFALCFLAAMKEQMEPVGYFHRHQYGDNCCVIENVVDEAKNEDGVFPLYTLEATK